MGRTKSTHHPHKHGPQVFRRGRYYAADLRPWKGGRPTLRDPGSQGWPHEGDKTEDEDEARRWAWRYVDALRGEQRARREGRPPKAETVAVARERYLRHRGRQVEMNTLGADLTALNHLEAYVGEGRRTDRITPEELQRWFDARLDQGYKASTLERYRLSMSAFFAYLQGPNPAGKVELPRSEERDARPWSDDELEQIRRAADKLGRGYRQFFELGVCTGGRYAELLALEWGDFDAINRTVRFRRQAVTEGTSRTKGLKGDRNRTALVLPEWWAWHDGGVGKIVRLRRPLAKVLKAAELKEPEILNHAMRHSYARICRERYHVPISILKVYLGHRSERVTERFYGWMGREVATDYGRQLVYGDDVARGLRRA